MEKNLRLLMTVTRREDNTIVDSCTVTTEKQKRRMHGLYNRLYPVGHILDPFFTY